MFIDIQTIITIGLLLEVKLKKNFAWWEHAESSTGRDPTNIFGYFAVALASNRTLSLNQAS